MKHYKLTLPQCKHLSTFDQSSMLEALVSKAANDKVATFETEQEYQAWLMTSTSS